MGLGGGLRLHPGSGDDRDLEHRLHEAVPGCAAGCRVIYNPRIFRGFSSTNWRTAVSVKPSARRFSTLRCIVTPEPTKCDPSGARGTMSFSTTTSWRPRV